MTNETPRGQSPSGPGTNDTTEYAPSKAPETKAHAEERSPDDVKDARLIPGGASGSPAPSGMSALDWSTVPSAADDPGFAGQGLVAGTDRPD
jgi:hypothetical protein